SLDDFHRIDANCPLVGIVREFRLDLLSFFRCQHRLRLLIGLCRPVQNQCCPEWQANPGSSVRSKSREASACAETRVYGAWYGKTPCCHHSPGSNRCFLWLPRLRPAPRREG